MIAQNIFQLAHKKPSTRAFRVANAFAASLLLVVVLVSGCASRREARALQKLIEEPVLPPAFLSGPAGVLWTNSTGFSARLELEVPGSTNKMHAISGQLLGQGEQLVFAPTSADKTFVWNVGEHHGWVFSEALQGYAPVSLSMQVTNISTTGEIAGPGGERVNGYRGHEAEVAVATDDGTVTRFSIWRAEELNGLPVRIKMLSVPGQPILNLSEVRLERLSPKLFSPPDDFTRYASAEAMSSELIMRKSKFRTIDTEKLGSPEPIPRSRGY